MDNIKEEIIKKYYERACSEYTDEKGILKTVRHEIIKDFFEEISRNRINVNREDVRKIFKIGTNNYKSIDEFKGKMNLISDPTLTRDLNDLEYVYNASKKTYLNKKVSDSLKFLKLFKKFLKKNNLIIYKPICIPLNTISNYNDIYDNPELKLYTIILKADNPLLENIIKATKNIIDNSCSFKNYHLDKENNFLFITLNDKEEAVELYELLNKANTK